MPSTDAILRTALSKSRRSEDACIAGHAQSAVRGDSSQPGFYVVTGVDLEAEPFVREEQKELKPETIAFRRKKAP